MFEDFEGILKNSTKMSPGGHPYKKGRGVLIRTFWGFSKSSFGASKSVQPQEVHTGAFAVPIKITAVCVLFLINLSRYWAEKNMTGKMLL